MDKDILKALNTIDEINPFATYLNDSTLSTVKGWVDTGSYVLNAIISGSVFGGIPKGRVTVLAGPSMTGKTYFIIQAAANAQIAGMTVVIFDTENAIEPESAARLGLDISKVKYVPCVSIEQTRNAIFKFLSSVKESKLEGKFFIAIDSLGNLQSEMDIKRMDKESTSQDTGTKARAMKTLMQTCTNLGAVTQTTIVMTNHVYDDPMAMYPSLEKNMPGGRSVVYLPSLTIQLARKPVKDDGKNDQAKLAVAQKNYSGVIIRALTVKNRFIKQYLEGEMFLSFSTGLDRFYGLTEIAVGLGVINQAGPTYSLPNGEKLGYFSKWGRDQDLWMKTIIPGMEEKMKIAWAYGSQLDSGVPSEVEDEETE